MTTASRRNARQNHLALAQQILGIARERDLKPGDHLPEEAFSRACSVSRTPIRAAFKILEENGILTKRQEQGYFLAIDCTAESDEAARRLEAAEESLARRILADRAERRIEDIQAVSALARRYGVSRSDVLLALKILSRDGLVTQLPGRAWAFQPLIDSPDALEESFEFRMNLEPRAILAPGFRLDTKRAGAVRKQMQGFLDSDPERRASGSFQRIDVEFHSMIAEAAGNRFLRGALLAHHRLRRASRQQGAIADFRLAQAMEEHLEVLDSLERHQFELAADQMRVHLRRSRIRRPEAANRGIPPLQRGPRP